MTEVQLGSKKAIELVFLNPPNKKKQIALTMKTPSSLLNSMQLSGSKPHRQLLLQKH